MGVEVVGMTAAALRREVNERALAYARSEGLLHAISDGSSPSVIFGRDEDGRHGNFYHPTYKRICTNGGWYARLNKVHTASRRMYVRSDWQWKELDCACSSDALLMNIFCHRDVLKDSFLGNVFGVAIDEPPVLGFRPRVPMINGRFDQTEVDMRLGDLLVEAKLTESDFQVATAAKMMRYRDVFQVFGWTADNWNKVGDDPLARRGYQAMRGILAAYASGGRFCLLCDARRTDLIKIWFAVLCRVQCAELRTRIMLLTWQELAGLLPPPARTLLARKYGIIANSCIQMDKPKPRAGIQTP